MREPGQRPSSLRVPASRSSSLPRVAQRAARRAAMGQLRSLLALAFCVLGIYASYLTQGVVQETLSTKKFGPLGERFSHLSSLNAVQCWVCFLWAGLLLAVFGKRCAGVPAPPRQRRRRRQRGTGTAACTAPPRACRRSRHALQHSSATPGCCCLTAAVRWAKRGPRSPPTGSRQSPTAWAPPAACRRSNTSPTPPRSAAVCCGALRRHKARRCSCYPSVPSCRCCSSGRSCLGCVLRLHWPPRCLPILLSAPGAGQVLQNDPRHAHGHGAARQALQPAGVRLLPGHLRWAARVPVLLSNAGWGGMPLCKAQVQACSGGCFIAGAHPGAG